MIKALNFNKGLEKFESILDALGTVKLKKAEKVMEESMNLVLHRIKLVRIANKTEFGSFNQYEADERLLRIWRTIREFTLLKGGQRIGRKRRKRGSLLLVKNYS